MQKDVFDNIDLQRTSERPREYLEPMLMDTHKYCYVQGVDAAMRI
jgi:hypothetical protein